MVQKILNLTQHEQMTSKTLKEFNRYANNDPIGRVLTLLIFFTLTLLICILMNVYIWGV